MVLRCSRLVLQSFPAFALKSLQPFIHCLATHLILLGQLANPKIATLIIINQTNPFTHRARLFPRHELTVTHVPGRFCYPSARNKPWDRPLPPGVSARKVLVL